MITTPNGARIPKPLELRCSRMVATGGKSPGKATRDLTPPPGQNALQPTRDNQHAGAPQLRNRKALNDDFGAAGQPSYRVEIAGIKDQRARDELLKAKQAATADPGQVGGQSPACVKGSTIDDDPATAQQRLEAGERGQGVQFVDLVEERRRGDATNHDVGESASDIIRDLPLTMSGIDIGMRLVKDEGVGIRCPDPSQQIKIAKNTFAAEPHREIVLDLSRHQYASPAPGPID